MTRRKGDALESAQKLRQAEQAAAEQRVAQCRAELGQAEKALQEAVRAERENESAQKELAAQGRLLPEGIRGAELQQRADYARHLLEQGEALKRKRERAARRRDEKSAELERARQQLQEALAARKAVQKRREKIEAEQDKQAEYRSELEAEEAYGARGERS